MGIRLEMISEIDLLAMTTQLGADWERLRGRRLFVTGGTGFFGTWLLESFADANRRLALGAEMVVLTRSPEAFARRAPHLAADPSISLWAGDVLNFVFPSGPFDYVLHGATSASDRMIREAPLEMYDVITLGTRRVLEFARQSGATRFLHVSSGAVYGPQPKHMAFMGEDYGSDAIGLENPYGEGKRSAEALAKLAAKRGGFALTIARCFAFVGPWLPLDEHFAIGNFIRDGLRGQSILVRGDGTPLRSYLYASDLTVWLWKILLGGQAGRAYNVGSDERVSVREVAELTARVFREDFGISVESKVLGVANPVLKPERYVPSVDRARNELGLGVQVPLREAIRRTVEWHRKSKDAPKAP